MTKLDEKILERIVERAQTYAQMANPLTLEAAIKRAIDENVVGAATPAVWGAYKKTAEARLKKIFKDRSERKKEEQMRGAQEAARARRDEAVAEAEASEEEISELRASYQHFRK